MLYHFKNLTLFAIITGAILCFSVLLINPVFAQAIPIPSVPKFTLKFIDDSYESPPTYGVDPFTGKNVTTSDGYYVLNQSIVLSIENQPFTPNTDFENHTFNLYFIIQSKGHYATNWSNITFINLGEYFPSSYSEYTLIVLGLSGNNGTYADAGYKGFVGNAPIYVEAGGEVDFRVQAFIAYYTLTPSTPNPYSYPYNPSPYSTLFTGENSDWSSTQSITIPEVSTLVNPTATPTVPELSWFPFLIIPAITMSLLMIFFFRIKKKFRTVKCVFSEN